MTTLTPGKSLPDSSRQMLCGLPFSTMVTRSFLSARWSTYTGVGSGSDAPCKQTAMLARQPNVVLTERAGRPSDWNSLVNELVSWMRGRSSATMAQVRTHDRLIPRD